MEIFSFDRLRLVMTKEIRENWRTLLMMLGVLLGTLIICAVLCGQSTIEMENYDYDPAVSGEYGVFTFLFYAFAAISASLIFTNMSSKEKRLSNLMTPASQLEKYIVRWIIFIPVFIVIYITFCYVADFIRYIIYVGIVPPENHPVELLSMKGLMEETDSASFILSVQIFLVIQSLFALGSSVWPRNSMIKSFLAYSVIFVIYLFIAIWANSIINNPDDNARIYINHPDGEDIVNLLWIPVTIICIFNYILAYWRYRESEIIERW